MILFFVFCFPGPLSSFDVLESQESQEALVGLVVGGWPFHIMTLDCPVVRTDDYYVLCSQMSLCQLYEICLVLTAYHIPQSV